MLSNWNLKRTLILGVLLYLLTLVWTLPAAVVWKRLQHQLPVPVTLHGLTGTLWSGQVNQLLVDGVNQGQLGASRRAPARPCWWRLAAA